MKLLSFIDRQTAIILLALLLLGCRDSSPHSKADPELVSSYRTQLLAESEAPGAVGILDLRAKMEGIDLDEHEDEHELGENGDQDAEHASTDEPLTDDGVVDTEPSPHEPLLTFLENVVVVGRVAKKSDRGGVDTTDFPWEKGGAAFVMQDPAAEGAVEGHVHEDGEDCPFCAKKKIESQAIVEFRDAGGQTIKIDARDLFDLRIDDLVVVSGNANLTGGVLMIDAKTIHVRR